MPESDPSTLSVFERVLTARIGACGAYPRPQEKLHGRPTDWGDQALIDQAHGFCRWRSEEGYSERGVVTRIVTVNPRMPTEQAWFLLRTAEASYCPWEIP